MSSAQDNLRSIACTQCGAPLQLLGGHRVRSVTCGYCGSVMDSRAEFEVVERFQNLKRPPSPIKIGMQGKLHDVSFTVIGVVQWQDDDGERWLEHLLFSPTHGYAWLEYDRGHFIFSRRIRDVPAVPTIARRRFRFDDRDYRVFSTYGARVVFVEGELTYLASVGDRCMLTDAISPPYMLCVERTESEEEYLTGEYLDPQAVYEAFGIDQRPLRRYSVHCAQPFRPGPLSEGMFRAALLFCPLSILIFLGIWLLGGGQVIASGKIPAGASGRVEQSATFDITDPDSLLRLELRSNADNGWAFIDVDVIRDNESVLSIAKGISYYSGYSGGEYWSEGSQSASAYFKLDQPGTYKLQLASEGGRGDAPSDRDRVTVDFSLREGVTVSRYFLGLSILFTLAIAWRLAKRWLFEARRWKSEQEDDDDD